MDYIDLLAYCRATKVITEEQYYRWLPQPAERVCMVCNSNLDLTQDICYPLSIAGSPEFGVRWTCESCQEVVSERLAIKKSEMS